MASKVYLLRRPDQPDPQVHRTGEGAKAAAQAIADEWHSGPVDWGSPYSGGELLGFDADGSAYRIVPVPLLD